MSTTSDPKPPGPSCPRCDSTATIKTHEQLGEALYFCPDCEHSWAHRPGKPVRPRAR